MIACGLDFGTSNSAIGIARDGTITLAPLEGERTLIPSAIEIKVTPLDNRGKWQVDDLYIDPFARR